MNPQHWIRAAGVAGMLGALAWMLGDILLVGNYLPGGAHGLLFDSYGERIYGDLAEITLHSSMSRLAAGALIGPLTIPLYLFACWHLYQGAKPAGRMFAVPTALLIFIGHAYSPLGHAGFYYVAAVYKTILVTSAAAHPALLQLAEHFATVLFTMYFAAVGCLLAGVAWLIVTMATGRSAWPRWMALATPLFIGLGVAIDKLVPFPQPVRAWVAGSGINTAWLLIFLVSTIVLWNRPAPS